MAIGYLVAVEDFDITAGDDYLFKCTYTEMREDGLQYPVYLQHCQIRGTARTQYNTDLDKFDLMISKDKDQMENTGVFYIYLPNILTGQYRYDTRPKKFLYDLQAEDAEGTIRTFQRGQIIISNDVTY